MRRPVSLSLCVGTAAAEPPTLLPQPCTRRTGGVQQWVCGQGCLLERHAVLRVDLMLQEDAAADGAAQGGWQAAKRADAHAPSAAVAAAAEPAACGAGDGSDIRGWGCVNAASRV